MALDKELLKRLGNASTEFIDGWIGEHAPGSALDGGQLVSVLVSQLANAIAAHPLEVRAELMNHTIRILVEHANAPVLVSVLDAGSAARDALKNVEPAGRA